MRTKLTTQALLRAALFLLLLLLIGCGGAASPAGGGDAGETAASAFVGTWQLAGIESRDANGETIPRETPPPLGFLMYDPAGYMGVVIQGRDRQPFAAEDPTPEEYLAAFRSYTSYFGRYTVDENAGTVTHHLVGSLSPNGAGSDYVRAFELAGDQLTLQPPPGADGRTVRLTWQRVPELAERTAEQDRFVGFWELAGIRRSEDGGEAVPVSTFETGYIIYTSTGHMAVHLMRPDREPFAGDGPSAAEAELAMRSYTSYFGPYTIHEDEGFVVHHRVGYSFPNGMGSDAQRFYTLSDDRLVLQPPVRDVDGREVKTELVWARLSE